MNSRTDQLHDKLDNLNALLDKKIKLLEDHVKLQNQMIDALVVKLDSMGVVVKDIDDNADLGQHCWDSTFAAESVVINNTSGVVSVAENATAVATVSATASACGSVAFSLAGTDSALFTVSSAGVVEFAAAPDYETPGDANSDNVYEFNAVATNGSATDSLAMVVTVTDVDEDIPSDKEIETIQDNDKNRHR